MSAIVSDTSPLNYLVLIDAISLRPRLFSEVIVPPAVVSELSQKETPLAVRQWLAHAPVWLKIQAPCRVELIPGLDAGETEAIFLAQELGGKSMLLDERKARQVAARLGLTPIGTLALLEIAAGHGWIEFDVSINRLRATTFRIHDRLIAEAWMRLQVRQS